MQTKSKKLINVSYLTPGMRFPTNPNHTNSPQCNCIVPENPDSFPPPSTSNALHSECTIHASYMSNRQRNQSLCRCTSRTRGWPWAPNVRCTQCRTYHHPGRPLLLRRKRQTVRWLIECAVVL